MDAAIAARLGRNLLGAYAEAVSRLGIEFASPQLGLVGGFVLAYGVSLVAAWDSIGPHGPAIVAALVCGAAGLLLGLAVAWRPRSLPRHSPQAQPVEARRVLIVAGCLVAIGSVAMVAYLLAIGQVPILMSDAEQGRVIAATRGGAPLRVLGLLALPGCWLLVGTAARSRTRGIALAALLALAVTSILQVSTANRAPVFTLIEVALVSALLASGHRRLRVAAIAGLAALGLVLVLLAGVLGALRLGSAAPAGTTPNYPALIADAISSYARVPVQNLGYTLDVVPDRIGWRLGFTYLQPILTALPGRQTTFDQDLKQALGQTYAGGGTVPGLVGESYANFGPAGWFLVPLLLAVWLTWLQRTTVRMASPEAQVLYSFAIVHAVGGTVSGLLIASPFPVIAYVVLGAATYLTRSRLPGARQRA